MYRTYNARPLPQPIRRRRSKKPLVVLLALLLLAGCYVAYALLRPLPAVRTTITPPVMPALVRVSIPWPVPGPTNTQAAFGADGYGLLASTATPQPAPIASVTKTVTALAVLDKKPLKADEQGPNIVMTAQDVDLYNQYVAKDGSVVPVSVGETITEYQALQAMMLPSANNIADSLAIWAFGSLPAYNQYANSYVKKLGMLATTITDASGFAPTTVSTPGDLVKLGDAALDNPALSEIIAQKQATFPGYGTIRNVNNFLGNSGIRGIKTGNTEEAGGCYLSAADIAVGDKTITVITAVIGAPDLASAMRASLPLVQSAPAQFQTVRVVRAGQVVGQAIAPWGASSDITADKEISATTWTGTSVSPHAQTTAVRAPAAAKTSTGSLSLEFNGTTQISELRLTRSIAGPDMLWRLEHVY